MGSVWVADWNVVYLNQNKRFVILIIIFFLSFCCIVGTSGWRTQLKAKIFCCILLGSAEEAKKLASIFHFKL